MLDFNDYLIKANKGFRGALKKKNIPEAIPGEIKVINICTIKKKAIFRFLKKFVSLILHKKVYQGSKKSHGKFEMNESVSI